MNWIGRLSSWYFSKSALPYWCIIILDLGIIYFSGLVADYLVFGGGKFAGHFWQLTASLLCTWPLYLIGMRCFHTYSGIIRYSSFVDLMRVTCALMLGAALSAILMEIISVLDIRMLLSLRLMTQALMFIMSMVGMWMVRIAVKYVFDSAAKSNESKRVFIYGVRDGGISLAKSMRNDHPIRYVVKGFVSNDKTMIDRYLVGVKVYAANSNLWKEMEEMHARILFVSPLCSEEFRNNQGLIDALMKAGVRIMMMPSAEKWDGKSKLNHSQLKEVEIEDLLPRDQIKVDLDAIGQMLKGKRILITGAAGSIGSEMVRQAAKFCPSELVLIDQAETPMHDVRLYMARNYPEIKAYTIVSSISNATHMEEIFSQHKPEYVFHAAAYKHVPMMEDNPAMAIQNNTYGTRVIADLAVKYGTKKFVMISTDKAVNPTNVMGCSKRICEIYCQALNKSIAEGTCPMTCADGSKPVTQFITTRFGNVLGSNGSVIPIFKEQIKKGGPVTVTHPDIIRFFMLIPEACQLVLEAGTMGNGGEIFVFDMGKPVRIADLAQRMIELSGAKDVEIKFTGLRDGEKLYEEVLNDEEQTKPTMHPKIKVAAVREYPYEQALANEEELYKLSFTYDDMKIVAKMKEIVPEYRSQHSKYEALDQKKD